MNYMIAVPTNGAEVDNHFGHCDHYTIYVIEDNEIKEKRTLPSPQGCGCKSGIAPVLANMGVKVMLAGSIGQGAVNVLSNNQIKVVRGCLGNTDELVKNYLAGNVADNGELCDHHECH